MKLILVRHGQTDWNKSGKFQGFSNIPLNETGRAQAVATAKKLADVKFDAIYSSPLERAKETCEIILKHNKKGGNIILDDRIKERNFGDFDGLLVADILKEEKSRNAHWWNYKNEKLLPNGETIADVTNRVTDFINDIKEINKDKTVLVVAHGGIARVIHFMFNKKPESGNLFEYQANNAEILEYTFS